MVTATGLSIPHSGSTLKLEIQGYGSGYTPTVTWPPRRQRPRPASATGVVGRGWGIDSLPITYQAQDVPGPLPALGAVSAFVASRRIRRRLGRASRSAE